MKELLARINWNQAQFAKRLGVSESTVGRWCKGTPHPAALAYLELLDRLING